MRTQARTSGWRQEGWCVMRPAATLSYYCSQSVKETAHSLVRAIGACHASACNLCTPCDACAELLQGVSCAHNMTLFSTLHQSTRSMATISKPLVIFVLYMPHSFLVVFGRPLPAQRAAWPLQLACCGACNKSCGRCSSSLYLACCKVVPLWMLQYKLAAALKACLGPRSKSGAHVCKI